MRRLLWPSLILVAFGIGLVTAWGKSGRTLPVAVPMHTPPRVAALQARIVALQQELARKEAALVELRQTSTSRANRSLSAVVAPPKQDSAPPALQENNESAAETETGAEQSDTPEPREVVWERFYQHLETTAGMSWSRRRGHERPLVADLRELGEPAVEALLQLLEEGTDTRERGTAAFLLGSMQDQRAVPILHEVLANEDDIVMRRAATRGMARIQTPDTIPILDTILTNGQEDRYMRLSAAYGLARMGESQGIDGLASIYEESNADGRGHYITFRALMALNDPRVLPVMRQIAVSESEVSYKLGAIRYLGKHGDQEALPFLQQMADASYEQQSVREAAVQALAAIGGGR